MFATNVNARARRLANVAAVAVILLAGAVSTAWVFTVPIFQAPDEAAHFDYAVSIYNAHRLIQVAEGTPDWLVNPQTNYLLRAVDFQRVAWHSSQRVPRGYGTRSFFTSIDRAAPAFDSASRSRGKINYIVRLYPFGFYALEALWMHAVALLTGSLVATFFAARLLCVLLLMAGLYFNYRTALNLGVPRWTSVALIAAIGLFPMTSFVSSYVQPDNLAYALLSAALFFATQLRVNGILTYRVALLGTSLGLLAITKYQFFLTAAIPILALLVVRLIQTRAPAWLWTVNLTLCAVPSLALFSVQHWIVDRPSSAASSPLIITTVVGSFASVLAQGFSTTTHYVVATGSQAFVDCFMSGGCAATFWQVVGIFDTPLVIVNPAVESFIRVAIALITAGVIVILAFYLIRNSTGICRAWLRRHGSLALRILVSDPVLNSYLCFIAIMVVLYVLSNNAYGAEGRHFYPYIFAAFLCFVWYAPRAFKKQRVLAPVFAGLFLCYSLAASSYALADVVERYYGPAQQRYVATRVPASRIVGTHSADVLRPVEVNAYGVTGENFPTSFTRGTPLLASGAVIVRPGGDPPVAVLIDNRYPVPVLPEQYQYRIGEGAHDVRYGYSGFFASIRTNHLSEGPHTVSAYTTSTDGYHYEEIHPVRLFFLTAEPGRFSMPYVRALAKRPVLSGRLSVIGTCQGRSWLNGNLPTAPSGAVLLFKGSAARRPPRLSVVWLLVDRRPYPAIYNDDGSIVGTIPTGNLAAGVHRLVAFGTLYRSGKTVRIAAATVFRVVTPSGNQSLLERVPSICRDALRQLAGTELNVL